MSPRDRGLEDQEDRYSLEVNGRMWGFNYGRHEGNELAKKHGPTAQKVVLKKIRQGKTPVTVQSWKNGVRIK